MAFTYCKKCLSPLCGGMDGLYLLREVSVSFVWWYGWPLLTVRSVCLLCVVVWMAFTYCKKCLSPLCGGMDGLYILQEPSLQCLSPTYGSMMNVFY